ncbi:MAG: 3-carboxy-cis,cis-muconate cycloisomerase [Gemmatimonadota bacterium]
MIFDALFGDPEVDAILSDASLVAAMLRVEVALAKAEAAIGIIPERAVDAIEQSADTRGYDLAALARDGALAGNLAIPLVRHLTDSVARIDADSARYVHWGATSQDIIDTAMVLQLRDATTIVLASLDHASDAAAALAERYAATVMAGRTWLQHATPITFGLKAAGWMSALDRSRAQVRRALTEAAVLQLGGASGTLAAFGDRGADVTRALATELALAVPAEPWHSARDRFATLACAFGVASGTMGKIARDVALLAQTEVAEAFEPGGDGRGSSSTMPQKRNPVGSAVILAASVRVPGLVATMLAAMPQEHERALGGWQAEWETMPALARLAAGAARHTAEILGGLEVDTARMRANVDMTHGVSLAESVSMALAEHIGRFDAHRMIGAAATRAMAEKRDLAAVLAEMPGVTKHLSRTEIERRLVPENYLGSSGQIVRDALAQHARERSAEARRDTKAAGSRVGIGPSS